MDVDFVGLHRLVCTFYILDQTGTFIPKFQGAGEALHSQGPDLDARRRLLLELLQDML